jgi:16S rRNA (cytidine1402-2'-O)-methyltransferase
MIRGPSERTFTIGGIAQPAPPLEPGLYVTATPIGNLGDVTLRALATLAAADVIACEDTRLSSRLTRHYGIGTKLLSYNDHNAAAQRPKLLGMIAAGGAVALISDAGTPLISDPGYKLVAEAVAAGFAVIPIPGASAAITALSAAGLPTDTFLFAGFLPPKETGRRKRLGELAAVPATLVFYEAPQRLSESLRDMADVLGADRQAVVAREITKTFETFRRGSLTELAAQFGDEPEPKGEITVLVEPPQAKALDADAVDDALRDALRNVSVNEAAAIVAAATGLPKRQLYARALALKGG